MTFVCALCCASLSYSQLSMGGWQTFFSYSNASNIIQSKDKIYALSDGNLFSIDKEYESIETYTKLTGLTDGNISKIAFCQSQNTLVIIYDNCNIDLMTNSRIINVSDLKRTEMSNKKVNKIVIDGNYAYLACGFGITVLDVAKAEILDTYILGEKGTYINVESITFHNDSIYAQSGNTIRYADKKDKNLADFNHWKNFYVFSKNIVGDETDPSSINVDSLKSTGDILPISRTISFGESLLFCSNDLLQRKDSALTTIRPLSPSAHVSINNDRMVISEDGIMIAYDNDLNAVTEIASDSIGEAIYDSQSKAYWACSYQKDGRVVLQKYGENGTLINQYIPNGPMSDEIAFIKYQDGKLFTGSGGPFDRSLATPGSVQILKDDQWSIITENGMDTSVLKDQHFLDVLDVGIDPKDPGHIFVATWKGLFEFQDMRLINLYNGKNSPLVADGANTLVDGLKFDKDGNLWMLNMLSHNPVQVLTPDRKWVQMSYTELQNTNGLRDLFIDSKGYLWVIIYRRGVGVFCANLNGTSLNEQDDKSKFVSTFYYDKENSAMTPTTIRCIAEDMDGVIWIGTDRGPLLIPGGSRVFESDFKVDRVKITREDNANYADYLLENEQINAIAIDGSNRKWIGTNSSGLYLLSPDGKETIHHFTTENSPFTSNAIMDLSINNETGELYIATSSGLFLYQSDATEGTKSYKNVYVYPNPVRETYTGPITVMGLLENSQVRISDSEGRIIHEGESNGGTYVWDGKDLNGRRVDTGIYFIYAAQTDGSSKMVTKIAIIK